MALPHFFQPNTEMPAAWRLDDYVNAMTRDAHHSDDASDATTRAAPAYIFSDHFSGIQPDPQANEGRKEEGSEDSSTSSGGAGTANEAETTKTSNASSILEVWPQMPSFMQDGIPGLAAFSVNNGQFYVGPPGRCVRVNWSQRKACKRLAMRVSCQLLAGLLTGHNFLSCVRRTFTFPVLFVPALIRSRSSSPLL